MRARIALMASLLAALMVLTTACGEPDQNPVGDTGVENDVGTDAESDTSVDWPEVDVWANGRNGTAGAAMPFTPGQSVGGAIGSSSGTIHDEHYFAVTLQAGTVFEFEFTTIGPGFDSPEGPYAMAFLSDQIDSISRNLFSWEGPKRQVFILETGTYYLGVLDGRAGEQAHGGTQSYYAIETRLVEVAPQALSAPIELADEINDGSVRIYSVVADQDGVLVAETLAWREPVESDLDTVLIGWDPAAKEVLAYNDDIDEQDENYDSLVVFEVEAGETYWLVIDSYANTSIGDYEFYVEMADDHPYAPRTLTPGTSLQGDIGAARDGEPDSDYFVFTAQPGQNVRVEVAATAEMQPSIQIYDDWGVYLGNARSVDNRAALEFAHEGTEEAEYFFIVDDQRNAPTEPTGTSENVGGANFGYTIGVEARERSAQAASFPLSEQGSIADVGEIARFTLSVEPNHIVQLKVSSEAANFVPFAGLLSSMGKAPIAYINTGAEAKVVTFGVRDEFYRGGQGYDFSAEFNVFSLTGIDYNAIEDPATNTAVASAQAVDLPIAISGTLAGTTPSAVGADFFKLSLERGETLIVHSSGDEYTDMIVRLLAPDGTTKLIENDYYLGQTVGYYSAFVFDVVESGDYTLVIEPFCEELFEGACAGNGAYVLSAFAIEAPEEQEADIELVGSWENENNDLVTITATHWGPEAIISHSNAERWVVTQNTADSAGVEGLFNKIVWTPVLEGAFHYCWIESDRLALEDAQNSEAVYDATDLVTGCLGEEWKRLTILE
ncbi:MAG: hypothetical protein H0U74_03965 [Bradymonadaceae bacterium]|nr:hypothetical protein [Lujinxingiaceae bacterium]